MATNTRLRAVCAASGISTIWVGAAPVQATPPDLEYRTFSGFGEESATDGLAAATKKKATKKTVKATKKTAKKKATTRKKAGIYRGADGVLRYVNGNTQVVSDDVEQTTFDYLLDFDAGSDSVSMGYHVLAVQDLENTPDPQISMFIMDGVAGSYIGVSWAAAFPSVDMEALIAAIEGESADTILSLVLGLPPNFAFLSSDTRALEVPISGSWISWPRDPSLPSDEIATVDGMIMSVPAPGIPAMLATLGALAMRRRRDAC